jgi:hypothetical protein
LASARPEPVPQIAQMLGCDQQTVRHAIHACNTDGLGALTPGSHSATTIHRACEPAEADKLRALLHQSPRALGKPTSLWTLELAADVSCAEGLTPSRVRGEPIRATLQRLGVRWQRAKRWITRPDPADARKQARATA